MTQEYCMRFCKARREIIHRCFASLNPQQQEAVLSTEGPMLLLAGAGSGKTTVLIHRIANLIRFGNGYESDELPPYASEQTVEEMEAFLAENRQEDPRVLSYCAINPVAPWNIIAITFTNKAANELKNRLETMLGAQALDVWAMTFHSACCRILRRNIDRMGFDSRFTIYDTADSERVMKDILKDMGLDEKSFPPKLVLHQISKAKDKLLLPKKYAAAVQPGDYRAEIIARAYTEYQRRLKEANALDFDDIILTTVRLLQEHQDVREYYQKKFRYVLIDEYQDTNQLQYMLASLLAGRYENICVVGDDDQSIYKFRGATITNILNFEQQYTGAKVIRLEQNYRSTKSILQAANAVIANNRGRKAKKLWTENEAGSKITVYEAMNEADEANFVSGRIFSLAGQAQYKDFAVLYRTNAQSNAIERAFKSNGIPYRIIGGTRFFDRAEVKDMLAYLWVINNRGDNLRLLRIVNNPPRGIGSKTLEMVQRLATSAGMPLYAVICDAASYPALEKSAGKLQAFAALMEDCASLLDTLPLPEFYEQLLRRTGYAAMLEEKDTVENRTRLENVRELKSSIVGYVENHPQDASLNGFLEEIALYTDIEQYDASADAVVMMTMHAAKGLEFPHVFIVGAEEGVFPGMRAIGEMDEMEEERRLCYVAITRAKKSLAISYADQRMLYGRTTTNKVSRFVEEIPQQLLEGSLRRQRPGVGFGGCYTSGSPFGGAGYRPAAYAGTSGERRRASSPHTGSYRASAPAPAAPTLQLQAGNMVEHTSFGRGMVLSVLPMGNDALLEIAFDQKGTKKLMAKTASSHMKKL